MNSSKYINPIAGVSPTLGLGLFLRAGGDQSSAAGFAGSLDTQSRTTDDGKIARLELTAKNTTANPC